jgi:hypothetical protein
MGETGVRSMLQPYPPIPPDLEHLRNLSCTHALKFSLLFLQRQFMGGTVVATSSRRNRPELALTCQWSNRSPLCLESCEERTRISTRRKVSRSTELDP